MTNSRLEIKEENINAERNIIFCLGILFIYFVMAVILPGR